MKAVITIIQCKRAVLPHVFVRHVLPRMRKAFGGEMEAVIIQHRADASGLNPRMESSLSAGEEKLARVRHWTEEGRYDGAEVVAHEIVHPPYPSIPSYHLAVKAALDRQADFHIWLEDDALINDPECGDWDRLLGVSEVGVYRKFHHLNTAYLVTRRSFAERILPKLADYSAWNPKSRAEAFLRWNLRTSRSYLNPAHATRYHVREYPYTGLRYVVQAVREVAPDALGLLELDFGPGCADLPPVTADEMAVHARADGAKPIDRLWRWRTAVVEGVYRSLGR